MDTEEFERIRLPDMTMEPIFEQFSPGLGGV